MNAIEKQRYTEILTNFKGLADHSKQERQDAEQAMKMQKDEEAAESDEAPDYKEGIFWVPETSMLQILRCVSTDEAKETAVVYDYKSLFIFSSEGKFRNFVVHTVHNPFFENFIILVIGLNTLGLAIYDYNDRDDKTEWN